MNGSVRVLRFEQPADGYTPFAANRIVQKRMPSPPNANPAQYRNANRYD